MIKGKTREKLKKITVWILLLVMGINIFGGSISSVKATGNDNTGAQNDINEDESDTTNNDSNEEKSENNDNNNGEQSSDGNETQETQKRMPGENVAWKDFSIEGGVINNSFSNEEALRLTEDLSVNDNMEIINPVWLDGHVFTIEGDLIINSSIYVDGILIVKGNVTWSSGDIFYMGGEIICNGNYQVISSYECHFEMKDEEDYMYIGGDFSIGMSSGVVSDITSGVINLAGDFKQDISDDIYTINMGSGCFKMEGESKLLLSGNDMQRLFIYNDKIFFNTIEVNTEGLNIDASGNIDYGDRCIVFSGKANYNTYIDHGCHTENGIIEYTYANISNDNDCVKIYGSTIINEPINVSCNSMYVIGDLVIDSAFNFTGNNLVVYGDLRIQSYDGIGSFGVTDGYFKLNQDTTIIVYGDVVSESTTDHSEYLNKGSWNLYGNIYQKGRDYKNLPFGGTATVELFDGIGTEGCERHISVDNTMGNPFEKFTNNLWEDKLVIDNCALFRSDSYLGEYKGIAGLGGEHFMGYSQGGIIILEPTTLTCYPTAPLTLDNNVIVDADLTITNDMFISGNLIVNNGKITMNSSWIFADDVIFKDGSKTQLIMTDSRDYISCENFIYGSKMPSGDLAIGTIKCTGDFIVKDTGCPDNFVASGDHVVLLEGEKLQNVNIEGKDSCIETLEISYKRTVNVSESTTIHNLINNNGKIIKKGIEGYTLEKDEVYNEDLVIACGNLDLNGHTLKVNGDMYAENGSIKINGGTLEVSGSLNYDIHPLNKTDKSEFSSADLIMKSESDKAQIGGNLNINIGKRNLTNAVNGVLGVGGDIHIDGVTDNKNAEYKKQIFDGVILDFKGDKSHIIEGGSDNIVMHIGGLTSENAKKISSKLEIVVASNVMLSNTEGEFDNITVNDITGSDIGSIKGNINIGGGKLTNDVEVLGKVTITGELDLAGQKISAANVYVNSPIHLSKGELVVSDTLYLNDKAWMINPEDTIRTHDISINMETQDSDYMNDGVIYVSGSFNDATEDEYVFLPSGNHKFIFDLDGDSANINYKNMSSRMMNAEFICAVSNYSTNREFDKIAENVIINYDDTTAPSKPANVTGKAYPFLVILSWDASTDNMDMDHYIIYRDGDEIGTTTETHYTDSILEPGKKHYYVVRAVDKMGNKSFGSRICEINTLEDVSEPVSSGNFFPVVDGGSFKVDLSRSFTDDNKCIDYYIVTKNGVASDKIYANAEYSYYDSIDEKIKQIVIHNGDSMYEDDGLLYGTSQEYMITAYDIAGNQSKTYKMIVHPDYAPYSPSEVNIKTDNKCNTITISAEETDACAYYEIFRDDNKINQINCVYGKDTVFIDHEVEAGNTYKYRVRGLSYHGTEGEFSDEYSILTNEDKHAPEIISFESDISGNILNEDAEFVLQTADEGGIRYIHVYWKQGDEVKNICEYNYTDYVPKTTINITASVTDMQGTYNLCVDVEDNSGNNTPISKTYTINIDGLPAVTQIRYSAHTTYVELLWNEIEGAKYYVVEKKHGNVYERIKIIEKNSIIIGNLQKETDYTFRIIAYDENNVRGLASRDIVITTKADTESPEITTVYRDGVTLGTEQTLLIEGNDNVGISSAKVYYRLKGNSDWTQIDGRYLFNNYEWDKDGLVSGEYEIKYVIIDTSGNESESVIGSYYLDLEAPVIRNFTITPKDWQIALSWDEFTEDDYMDCQLERMTSKDYDNKINSGKTVKEFNGEILKVEGNTYEEIIGPEEEYVYILRAYDKWGNESVEVVRGRSVNNDVFSPVINGLKPMVVACGSELFMTAEECTDNAGIVSYKWDMGNGDIVNGIDCDYIYTDEGNYNVILTITDAAGNVTSEMTSVLVCKDVGEVVLNVTDGKKPIEDVYVAVCINNKPYYNGETPQTDAKGNIKFNLPSGKFQIGMYKNGYRAEELSVNVKSGVTSFVSATMAEGSLTSFDIESREVSPEEMVDLGIDSSDVGVHAVETTITLTFQKEKIKKTIINLYGDDDVPKRRGFNGSGLPGSSDSDNVVVKNISPERDKPIYIITRTVSAEVSWMKDVYHVEAILKNDGDELFELKNTKAILDLPEGLSLTNKNDGQSNIWDVGDIKGGQEVTNTWYITGEKKGSYNLSLDIEATLYPMNVNIHEKLVSKSELRVTAGEGLHLYVYPEADAYLDDNCQTADYLR